jgi:biopolymer transport protein ExbD
MKFRRNTLAAASVNLTPLIDMVFLLLIFFMVSTTFTKETHLTLKLPEADGQVTDEKVVDQIEVVVSMQGQYSVNGQSLVNNRLDTLMKALQTIAGKRRDLPMIITADANATHQSVMRAMDAASQLGFSKLSLTAQLPEKNSETESAND